MPENAEQPQQQPPVLPLLAPIQMLAEGFQIGLSSVQSMAQGFANVNAMNLQGISSTIQKGQAQFIGGMNTGLAQMDGFMKKPLVDASQLGQGGRAGHFVPPPPLSIIHPELYQGAAPQQQQQAPAPLQATIFSPVEAQTQPVIPSKGEQYHPLTEDQSNFREGGFTQSPRGADEPTQKKNIKTLFL